MLQAAPQAALSPHLTAPCVHVAASPPLRPQTVAPAPPRTQQCAARQQRHCRAPALPPPAAAAQAAASEVPHLDAALDDELSRRPLALDPAGYFIIKVDRGAGELVADFYTNTINEQGAPGCCCASCRALVWAAGGCAGACMLILSLTPRPPPPVHSHTGLACDPATGEVISCKPGAVRQPTRTWRGRTAKAVGVAIVEQVGEGRSGAGSPC